MDKNVLSNENKSFSTKVFIKKYDFIVAVALLTAVIFLFACKSSDDEQALQSTATAQPTVSIYSATPEITPEAEVTPADYITIFGYDPLVTFWVNASTLTIRENPDSESEALGEVPYGEEVSGHTYGKWLNITYNGITGYIYLGETSEGRACVVYSKYDLEPLE